MKDAPAGRGVAGRSAISALAAIGHPSTIPLFEVQTTSGYPAHRWAAYEGLARSGGAIAAVRRIGKAGPTLAAAPAHFEPQSRRLPNRDRKPLLGAAMDSAFPQGKIRFGG